MKEDAKWNTKYITKSAGRVYKIKDLSLKQTNSCIADAHAKIRVAHISLKGLYERRAVLLGEPIEKGKAERKIKNTLRIKEEKYSNDAKRMQGVIALALKHLSDKSSYELVAAILEQARQLHD